MRKVQATEWPTEVIVLRDDMMFKGGYSLLKYYDDKHWDNVECPRCVTEWSDWIFDPEAQWPYTVRAPLEFYQQLYKEIRKRDHSIVEGCWDDILGPDETEYEDLSGSIQCWFDDLDTNVHVAVLAFNATCRHFGYTEDV